jgi:hypothetical protein
LPWHLGLVAGRVACSGDTTREFTASRHKRAPQLDAVDQGYDLIFLTIGGNDVKFDKIVKFCLIAKFRDGANCNPLLSDAEIALVNGTMRKRVFDVLEAIRARVNPKATMVLLGYPYLEGDSDYTLRSGHGGSTFIKVGQRVRHIGDLANKVQGSAVTALNRSAGPRVVFVKTTALFEGPPNHELFAKKNNPKRWFIQPFVDVGLAQRDLFYHPNPTGWQEEAELLPHTAGVPKTDPVEAGGRLRPPTPAELSAINAAVQSGPDGTYFCASPTSTVISGEDTRWAVADMYGNCGTASLFGRFFVVRSTPSTNDWSLVERWYKATGGGFVDPKPCGSVAVPQDIRCGPPT